MKNRGGEVAHVRVRRLRNGRGLPLPAPATTASAGCDLRAALAAPITLRPGEHAKVPTGIALEIPRHWEAQIRPRSGLAMRHGVTVLNSPGTIDSDYRGEISVLLVNLGSLPFEVQRGDRIAQVVVSPVADVVWEETEKLSSSSRDSGGFGSTG